MFSETLFAGMSWWS